MSNYRKIAGLMIMGLLVGAMVVGCEGSKGSTNNVGNNPESSTLIPANNATNVCVDTLLKLTFDSGTTPVVAKSGTIKIYKASDDTVVDTINLADGDVENTSKNKIQVSQLNTKQNWIGNSGKTRIVNYRPVNVKNNSVIIVPHNNKLSYNTKYYVTIDSGVLSGSLNGSVFSGITSKTAWTFTTKNSAPNGTVLSVDANGNGDFCTIQGAIDNIPSGNNTAYTINIADGIYEEMLFINSKQNIALQGATRKGTIVQYDNCDSFNNGSGGGMSLPISSSSSEVERGGRSIMLVINSSGLVINNLTLKSTHAQNSESSNQAEVMYLNSNSGSDRYIVKNCDLISYQDTVQNKGYCWYYNCFITGDVDFIWGSATTSLFENCEIQSRFNSNGGYVVQARAAAGNKGYVFLNCELTKESDSVTGIYLARSAQTSGANSAYYDNVAYINCQMDSHILPVGWQLCTTPAKGPNPETADATNGWKEYGSTDLNGTALDVSSRLSPGSHQLTSSEYDLYKDRATIFGGWDPQP